MSERYSKLFSLPENLYTVGAPVVIAAGALLKDNQTGKVLAQIKIKNISDKTIKAAKVKLTAYDTVGKTIGEEKENLYLDLCAKRNDEFGQKVPIYFDDKTTRSFGVVIGEIIFDDNSIWQAKGNEQWECLPNRTALETHFKDKEIAKQYQINTKSDGNYLPCKEKDLWFCMCGEINHESEMSCHSCKKEKEQLFNVLDIESLKSDCDERLKNEKEEAVKKSKRKSKKAMIIILTFIVAVAIGLIIGNNIKKANIYKNGVSLLESQRYEEAISVFESISNYKDSKDMKIGCEALLKARESLAAAAEIDIPDNQYTKELKEMINTYLPYCGRFKEHDLYYVNSDFEYIDGKLYWNVSEEIVNGMISWKNADGKIVRKSIYGGEKRGLYRLAILRTEYFENQSDCEVKDMTVEDTEISITATVEFSKNKISCKRVRSGSGQLYGETIKLVKAE